MHVILIHADESAEWVVAGLRQLDRIVLGLDEAFDEPVRVWVLWNARVSPQRRWLPTTPDLSTLNLGVTEQLAAADLVLTTRVFLYRKISAEQLKKISLSLVDRSFSQDTLGNSDGWEYLADPGQISECEKRFLRGSGKSQDGFVSRYLNRPVSRALSRVLLRLPLTPTAWTLGIFVLAVIGAWFLSRGDYLSIVVGLLFFQVFSMVDGCDGEIARAKYLESEFGRQLDTWCDTVGNLLLVLALGCGLSGFYAIEGPIVAALIIGNELLLALLSRRGGRNVSASSSGALYPRHRQMIERSGLLFFGERFVSLLIQLTKRDVALLAFLILAILGRPEWILHLLGAVAAISLLLALKSLSGARESR